MQGIYIYGIAFLISIISARIIEIDNRIVRNKIINFFLMSAVVIPPCLLAGIRADTVGVDTLQYLKQYNYASLHKDYLTIYALFGGGTEVLIAFMVYVLSLYNVSATGYLFIVQLLTMIPVILVAKELKAKTHFSWIIACYLFLFYNNSLNLIRQSLSVAWLTLMTVNLISNGNKLKGKSFAIIVPGVIGSLMHKSGMIGLVLHLFCCFITNRSMKQINKAILYVVFLIAVVFSGQIVDALTEMGIISSSLASYGELFIWHTKVYDAYFINPFGIYGIPDVLIRLSLIILPSFALKSHVKQENDYKTLRFIVATGFIIFTFVLFAFSTNYGQRISMFVDFMLIVFIPYALKNSRINPKNPYLYAILVTYWIIWIFFFGWSGSANYVINPNF